MKKSILLLAFLLTGLISFGQGEMKNSIQIDWGVGFLDRQDLSFTSLVYKPVSLLNTQITYQRTGNWAHDISTRFGLFRSPANDSYSYYNAYQDKEFSNVPYDQFVFLDINYGLSKSVFHNEHWNISVGGRERNRLQIADFSAGEGTHFSYYFCFGIDAKINAGYTINEKNTLISNLYLPVFSHIARNPYSAQDGAYFYDSRSNNAIPTVIEYIKGGRLESWKNSQILDLDISYSYKISDRWAMGLKYLLSMNFNQYPNTLNSIENYYYLNSTIKF